MFGTFRKHSQWLWWLIIAGIIITFVFWGAQSSLNGGGGGPRGSLGSLNGETISPTKYEEARRETYLAYFFSSGGTWPGQGRAIPGFDVERETYFRLLMIQKQEQMGVHLSEEAIAKVASERLRSMNRGHPVPPDVFAKQVLAPQNLTMMDFERYLRHELGVQQLVSVLGLGGELVTPQEVRAFYTRVNQEIQAQVAFFSASNYLDSVKPTPEQIGEFYTNQMARYRLPDRIQVNYVKFPLSNYLAEAIQKLNENTNLHESIEAFYQQRGGTNFYTEKSPEEAKQQILKEVQDSEALELARKKALEFATMLYTNEPMRPENLATLAQQNGLTPLVSPPFSKDEPPVGLDVRADFLRAAFALNAEEPFSQTLVGNDGIYLISLNKSLPSEIPPLEAIREQVTRDYRFNEAVSMAQKAAMDFGAAATNITSAPAFVAACAVAKVKPISLPPFSLSTRNLELVESHVDLSQFKQVVFGTLPGHMSQLQPSFDGAYAVFVQEKLPLDEAKLAANLPTYERSVRQTRRAEAFNDWFRNEAEKAFREVPYFQRPSPAPPGSRS
ncbi:MAG TPA: SurA N-terminal domain-containing protein [Verrucomicrobiae bacterium]|nr:SurA N-terminal domain-containing protein [Verrucomicrobiae bacterium]